MEKGGVRECAQRQSYRRGDGVSTLLYKHVKMVIASLGPQPRSLTEKNLSPGICMYLDWFYGDYSVSVDRLALRSDAS